jgi:hypothetical protein
LFRRRHLAGRKRLPTKQGVAKPRRDR